jgi:hypothetical protein
LSTPARLLLADSGEAADLAAFLERLLRFDRAAAVRLQVVRAEHGAVLAVFGRLPLGSTGVLALRSVRLPGDDLTETDLTVSAGQLLESVDEPGAVLGLPAPVTGPAWVGLLPPRSRWERTGVTTAPEVMPELMAAVREFKQRTAEIPEHHRTRTVLDALADEIWSRPLGAMPELPLRAAHAAYLVGFLAPDATLTAHRSGSWLRLSAPAGSVALRTAAPGSGLGFGPLR